MYASPIPTCLSYQGSDASTVAEGVVLRSAIAKPSKSGPLNRGTKNYTVIRIFVSPEQSFSTLWQSDNIHLREYLIALHRQIKIRSNIKS